MTDSAFFGPRVVRAAFVIAVFGWGLGFYGPPVFLHAVIARTGWSLAFVSTCVTLHFLSGAVVMAIRIEGANPAPLREASERYGADALLAVHAREEGGQWQAKWRMWLGDQQEQGSAQAADQAALADAVMLAVSERLAPRYVVKPGISTEQLLEVHGMTLERYASLGRLLEPFGGQLVRIDGDRSVYQVNGSAEQLRAQLGLAHLQEIPASEGAPVTEAGQTPAAQLRFRW